jgi:hypothetical protein
MIPGLPILLDSLFGVKTLDEVSVEALREMVSEFPSFNAGHFLLSRKLQADNDPAFEEETRKTALYFNNPVWLQWLLDSESGNNGHPAIARAERMPPSVTEPETIEMPEEIHPGEPDLPPDIAWPETVVDVEEEPNEADTANFRDEVGINGENHAPLAETDQSSGEAEPAEIIAAEAEPLNDTEIIPMPDHDGVFQENHEENQIPPSENDVSPVEGLPETILAGPEDSKEPELITVSEEPETAETAAPEPEDPGTSRQREPETTAFAAESLVVTEEPPSFSNYAPEAEPALRFDTKKAESIVFEPYHVIDYFASQGIKLVIEDQPTDSFGKQLKSFTDWLKVMKRLPPKPVTEEQEDRESERIRHFAAHSIEEKDVLTETMAEVLAKQGMYEPAVALYRKLSLLYPSKSAYFAARIEKLKPFLT